MLGSVGCNALQCNAVIVLLHCRSLKKIALILQHSELVTHVTLLAATLPHQFVLLSDSFSLSIFFFFLLHKSLAIRIELNYTGSEVTQTIGRDFQNKIQVGLTNMIKFASALFVSGESLHMKHYISKQTYRETFTSKINYL